MQSISFYIKNPKIFATGILLKLNALIPEKTYLKLLFRLNVGYKLNLKKPETFNEKLQWLKLYDRKPDYTSLVDKYEVKNVVSKIIGEEHIVPTLGVWNNVEEIDWSILPNQFVLKTTHGSGGRGVVICNNKECFNIKDAKEKLSKSLSQSDTYAHYREWPYKNIKRRIIAEKLLVEALNSSFLKDYKFFCFNGKVRFFKVDYGRFTEHHANYYNTRGKLLPFGEADFMPDNNQKIELPNNLEEMISIASKISKGHSFLRVDLYNVNGFIYFGEATFYPASGMGKFSPNYVDYEIGKLLTLPITK